MKKGSQGPKRMVTVSTMAAKLYQGQFRISHGQPAVPSLSEGVLSLAQQTMWDLWWIKQHKTLLLVFRFSSVSSHSVMLHIHSHSVRDVQDISIDSNTPETYSHPTATHKVITPRLIRLSYIALNLNSKPQDRVTLFNQQPYIVYLETMANISSTCSRNCMRHTDL